MADIKVIRQVGVGFSDKATEAAGPVHVDLYVDGEMVPSATGPDDTFALQNLITKMEANSYSANDIATVKGLWRIELGLPYTDESEDDEA